MKTLIQTTSILFALALFPSCSESAEVWPPDGAGLKALMGELQGAIRSGESARAAELTSGLFPSAASIKGVLRDGSEEVADKIAAMHTGFTQGADLASLFQVDSAQTEIQVHRATTAEIAESSVAAQEFPGGATELAGTVLRGDATFYEVECLEPGKDDGMKYHLFFHDGDGWRMLGPAWRAVR